MNKTILTSVVLAATLNACAADMQQDDETAETASARASAQTEERSVLDTESKLASAAVNLGADAVGVVKAANTNCPNGEIDMGMDNENHNNNNSRSGWIGATASTQNTTFKFCYARGSDFHQVRSDNANDNYAVIKLGTRCPAGSVEFWRHFDGEDDNTSTTVWVGPVGSGNAGEKGNLDLHFCLFRASPSAPTGYNTWPSIGVPYGVFGSAGLRGTLEAGNVYTDDEDDNNHDTLGGDYVGSERLLEPRFKNGGTRLYMARVR
jgi:hypothetical protein